MPERRRGTGWVIVMAWATAMVWATVTAWAIAVVMTTAAWVTAGWATANSGVFRAQPATKPSGGGVPGWALSPAWTMN
jgi:hypothetical protein